ncbi:MAG: hypothetical protein OEY97_07745 [Nitrospirota bacterium]|nr:hypothetical protein [Gammaproteobacteria bacterium]MDH5527183.1 hypothetical protein [Nitrospirota bacterium]
MSLALQGNPVFRTDLPLGSITTYSAGTTDLLATYTDAAMAAAHANPVVLDSNGEAVIYWQAQSYKLVYKNAGGATVKTVDNFRPYGYEPILSGVLDSADYATLQEAVTAAGVNTVTLRVHTALPATANVTVPSTMTLDFIGSGVINRSPGVTVTLNSAPVGDIHRQIFTGTGTTAGTFGGERINIRWFGAVGDAGTTDNAAPISAAITAASGSEIFVPNDHNGGDYAITTSLTITGTARFVYAPGARIYASGAGTITDTGRHYYLMGGGVGDSGSDRDIRGIGVYVLGGNTLSGTTPQEIMYNHFKVDNDVADATAGGGSKANALMVDLRFGDSNTKGGRHALMGRLIQSGATNSANSDRNYAATIGQVLSSTGDGGGPGTEKGAYFGINGYCGLNSGCTNTLNATAAEFNTVVSTGASTLYRTGIQVAMGGDVRGSSQDIGIALYNLNSATIDIKTGINIGPLGGTGTTIGTDGTAIKVAQTTSITNAISITTSVTGSVLSFASGSVSIDIKPGAFTAYSSGFGIEIGSLGAANSPHIDFHSSGNNIDYDSRISASGGSGTIGQGTISIAAAITNLTGVLQIGGTQVVKSRITGWATATGTATRTTFNTATVTLPQLAERVKALIDDLHGTAGHGLIGT